MCIIFRECPHRPITTRPSPRPATHPTNGARRKTAGSSTWDSVPLRRAFWDRRSNPAIRPGGATGVGPPPNSPARLSACTHSSGGGTAPRRSAASTPFRDRKPQAHRKTNPQPAHSILPHRSDRSIGAAIRGRSSNSASGSPFVRRRAARICPRQQPRPEPCAQPG